MATLSLKGKVDKVENFKRSLTESFDRVNQHKPIAAKPKQKPQKTTVKPQKIRTQRAKKALAFLCERYPNVFNMEAPRPLKHTIHGDLLALDHHELMPACILRRALYFYANGMNYLLAMQTQTNRFDLAGEVVGTISESEKEHAIMKYQDILLKKK